MNVFKFRDLKEAVAKLKQLDSSRTSLLYIDMNKDLLRDLILDLDLDVYVGFSNQRVIDKDTIESMLDCKIFTNDNTSKEIVSITSRAEVILGK